MNETTPAPSLPDMNIDELTKEIDVIISFTILDIEIAAGRYDHAA